MALSKKNGNSGIIEFGDDLTISGWLHSKRSRLKLSSDSISIGFSPFDSVYSINSSSVCEPELRRNVRKEIAPRDEDQVFSFSGVTIDVLSLEGSLFFVPLKNKINLNFELTHHYTQRYPILRSHSISILTTNTFPRPLVLLWDIQPMITLYIWKERFVFIFCPFFVTFRSYWGYFFF